MSKFKKSNLIKLTQLENLNKFILVKEIESVLYNLPKN